MNAHTPGPWRINQYGAIVDTENQRILTTGLSLATGYSESENPEANARLIAAACSSYDKHCGERAVECAESDLLGELLEALQTLIERIGYYSALAEQDRPNIEQWEYTNGSDDMKKARAAIAKATGETP